MLDIERDMPWGFGEDETKEKEEPKGRNLSWSEESLDFRASASNSNKKRKRDDIVIVKIDDGDEEDELKDIPEDLHSWINSLEDPKEKRLMIKSVQEQKRTQTQTQTTTQLTTKPVTTQIKEHSQPPTREIKRSKEEKAKASLEKPRPPSKSLKYQSRAKSGREDDEAFEQGLLSKFGK